MAVDPRSFTVKTCPKTLNTSVVEGNKKKDFFGTLGKVGAIEGLGSVGTGLRTLAKLSDSVRTGDTKSAIIPNSYGYVFTTVGINPNAVATAGNFNPGAVNKGIAQAKSILTSVKSGTYKLTDIPNTFSDLQNLKSLVGGIYTPPSQKADPLCDATPYAIDLIQYAPKYKFLFIVQITLSTKYQDSMGDSAKKLAFVVKHSTRPNVNIEHEEINMYNFWTRIPKRTVYEPITMRFYDDNKGLAHLFYTTYLRSISPITRLQYYDINWIQANSMNQNSADVPGAASLSALEGNVTSIISDIKLFHIYDYGKMMNVYRFLNPKLLTMNLDELDMAESAAGNEIELQFAYDAMHITPAFSVADNIEYVKSMSGGSIGALRPIVPNFLDGDTVETPEGIDSEGNPLLPDITNGVTDAFNTASAAIAKTFSFS